MQQLPVKFLREGAKLPTYGSDAAAGADLYACLEQSVNIAPGETAMIPTGLAMEIPAGYVGLICARSGLSIRRGLAPANKVGVIDADYRGEVLVALYNHGSEAQTVEPGERIAQFLLTPCLTADFVQTDTLHDTVRGEGGFGSTGRK